MAVMVVFASVASGDAAHVVTPTSPMKFPYLVVHVMKELKEAKCHGQHLPHNDLVRCTNLNYMQCFPLLWYL